MKKYYKVIFKETNQPVRHNGDAHIILFDSIQEAKENIAEYFYYHDEDEFKYELANENEIIEYNNVMDVWENEYNEREQQEKFVAECVFIRTILLEKTRPPFPELPF